MLRSRYESYLMQMDNSSLILEFCSSYYIVLRFDGKSLEQPDGKSVPSNIEEDETWQSISFDQPPRNVQSGFTFGTDPDECDFVLIDRYEVGRSAATRQHFSITFDEKGRLVLKNHSQTTLAVGQNYQHENEFRHDFLWILFGRIISVKIQTSQGDRVPGVIQLKIPDHSSCRDRFYSRVRKYLRNSREAVPPLGLLGFGNISITAYQSCKQVSRSHAPIYHKISNVGKGGFGIVEKVLNVSTGEIYARKKFGLNGSFRNEIEILNSLEHVSENNPASTLVLAPLATNAAYRTTLSVLLTTSLILILAW